MTRPTTLNLVDLIERYTPVQTSILQQLEIRDIISLSCLCKKLSHVYSTTIKTQYNINDQLKRFFNSPVEFRNVQAETDAIMCNTVALYFFLRRPFPGVSILVSKGASTARMLQYLEEDGWRKIGATEARDDYDELHYLDKHATGCPNKVRNKVTKDWESCPCPRLSLAATCEPALSSALVTPDVTEALNIITCSHAYSFLPYATFILKRSFLLENAVDGFPQRLGQMLKSKKRIYDLATEPIDIRDAQNKSPATFLPPDPHGRLVSRVDHGHRRIGDRYTWTIALNTDGIRQPTRSTIPTTYASFRIIPESNPPPIEDNHGRLRDTPSYYYVLLNLIAAPCLKYEYFVDPTDRTDPAHSIVARRYKEISFAQIEALEDEEKPLEWTTNNLPSLSFGWEKFGCEVPVGWKWYDDEVEELLRARWNGDSPLDGVVDVDYGV